MNSLQDPQLNERVFQTAGVLTLKALADNANDVHGTVSNSLSADLRQRVGLQSWIKHVGWSKGYLLDVLTHLCLASPKRGHLFDCRFKNNSGTNGLNRG